MGADPWICVVAYQADIRNALAELQERLANDSTGRAAASLGLSGIGCSCQAVGHLQGVRDAIEPGFTAPLPSDVLVDLYGTENPSRLQVEADLDFFEELDRGASTYIVVHENGVPMQIVFAGYSWD